MLRLQWNALRVGDPVLVHDASDAALRLVPGIVAIVERANGSSDIGIDVASDHTARRVVRPLRLAVHPDPVVPTEPCWRCDGIESGTAARRQRVPADAP